jgi:SNF2 family DNA or RNA helicase
MIELYGHQDVTADFGFQKPRVFDMSDPGTGKTLAWIEAYHRRRKAAPQAVGRMLVVCPLSIMSSAWVDDIKKHGEYSASIAHGRGPKDRIDAFRQDTDIVIINTDGVKWLKDNLELVSGFTDLIIDESTSFKNRTSQRSRAMLRVSTKFSRVACLTGTPNPNSVVDLWHQAFLLDHGKRLGDRFYSFRHDVQTPEEDSMGFIKWVDKPGAGDFCADALRDITVRHKFEDCLDIPAHTKHVMRIDTPAYIFRAYKQMEKDSSVTTEDGTVNAVHASARVKKMLQILSGALYDEHGEVKRVHNERYELVMQLVAERDHSLVAFNWTHERQALCDLADKMGITYTVIDGKMSAKERTLSVEGYQSGDFQVAFCHPQSAAHGLTLTRGRTTIWTSPTYSSEQFVQFNRRIYRAGQDKKTETICIAAKGTREEDVYRILDGKLEQMTDLLTVLTGVTR